MSTAEQVEEQEEQQESPRVPAVMSLTTGGAIAPIIPKSIDECFRLGDLIVKAKMAPKAFENNPPGAMVAIMHGLEVGMTPMAALQSIAVINGTPSIWGDGALGLVRSSGLLEYCKEYEEEREGDGRTAVCVVKRRNEAEPIERTFSEADAQKAGLDKKSGPWTNYPRRMRQMRARAWALRDGFADVLKGLKIREEVEDYELKDVTPAPTPPPPAKPATVTSQPRPTATPAPKAPPPAATRKPAAAQQTPPRQRSAPKTAAQKFERKPDAEVIDPKTGEVTEAKAAAREPKKNGGGAKLSPEDSAARAEAMLENVRDCKTKDQIDQYSDLIESSIQRMTPGDQTMVNDAIAERAQELIDIEGGDQGQFSMGDASQE